MAAKLFTHSCLYFLRSSPGISAVSSFLLLCFLLVTCTELSLALSLVYQVACLGTWSRVSRECFKFVCYGILT